MINEVQYWQGYLLPFILALLISFAYIAKSVHSSESVPVESVVLSAMQISDREGIPGTTFTVELKDGTKVAIGFVSVVINTGDIVCLNQGKNLLGFPSYSFRSSGKCT